MADEILKSEEMQAEEGIGIADSGVELDLVEETEGEGSSELDEGVDAVPEETVFSDAQIRQMETEAEQEAERFQAAADAAEQAEDALDLSSEGATLAGRRNSRRRNPGEYSHAIGDRTEFESPREKYRRIVSEYVLAARRYHNGTGIVRSGTIMAIDDSHRIKTKAGDTVRMPCAKIIDGPVVVYIPIIYLTRLRIDVQGNAAQKRASLRSLANARIGSEVQFIVMSYNEETGYAIGNRLAVLDREKRLNYLTKTRNGGYLLNEGDIVEARVTYVTSNHMGIEAFGEEASLSIRDITYSHTRDLVKYLQDRYGVSDMTGRTLPVKITALSRDPFAVSFSVKEATYDERVLWIRGFNVGDLVKGEVVTVNVSGIFVRIGGTELDCICNYDSRATYRTPAVNDVVIVRLNNVDKENLRVAGSIRKIIG